MIPYKQLSVEDILQDCQNKFNNDKPAFLSLLEQHIDLDEIIPVTFYNHFYASTGRYELLLKETSITSRKTSVSQDVVLKMNELCMLI